MLPPPVFSVVCWKRAVPRSTRSSSAPRARDRCPAAHRRSSEARWRAPRPAAQGSRRVGAAVGEPRVDRKRRRWPCRCAVPVAAEDPQPAGGHDCGARNRPGSRGARKRSRTSPDDIGRFQRDVLVDDVGRRSGEGRRLRAVLGGKRHVAAHHAARLRRGRAARPWRGRATRPSRRRREARRRRASRSPRCGFRRRRRRGPRAPARHLRRPTSFAEPLTGRVAERARDLRFAGCLRARRRCRRSAPWRR